MDPGEVGRAVASAKSRPADAAASGQRPTQPAGEAPDEQEAVAGPSMFSLPADPATRLERDAIMAILQQPTEVGRPLVERPASAGFANASLAVVRDAIASSLDAMESTGWLERTIDEVPAPFSTLVKELGLAPIPEKSGRELAVYCQGIASALIDRDLLRRKAELLGRLQRTDAAAEVERYGELQRELVRVEAERRALRAD